MANTSDPKPKIVMDRLDLIHALEARRAWARNLDKSNKTKHAAAEKACLEEWRTRLRDAAKWTYAELKEAGSYPVHSPSRPSCPDTVLPKIETALAALRLDQTKTITCSADGQNSRLYWLLTHDETAAPTVC